MWQHRERKVEEQDGRRVQERGVTHQRRQLWWRIWRFAMKNRVRGSPHIRVKIGAGAAKPIRERESDDHRRQDVPEPDVTGEGRKRTYSCERRCARMLRGRELRNGIEPRHEAVQRTRPVRMANTAA